MTVLPTLLVTLETLNMPYKEVGDYLRVFCPLPHSKDSSKPSATFHRKSGSFFCFSCKESARSVEDFLSLLDMLTRYKLQKHPDQTIPMKNKRTLISKALEAINTSQATLVSTTI